MALRWPDGSSELTVDDVCAEAEVSKGAFYGYFSSNQDLLIALPGDFHQGRSNLIVQLS